MATTQPKTANPGNAAGAIAVRGPGRPPGSKASDTRERILLAARQVFAERGYAATTFQEVANAAGLTRPAINHYFASKRLLYREVIEELDHLIAFANDAANQQPTLRAQLSGFASAAVEFGREVPYALTTLRSSLIKYQRHPDIGGEGTRTFDQIAAFVSSAVDRAVDQGELSRNADAAAIVGVLLSVIFGISFAIENAQNDHEVNALVQCAQQLMHGSLWCFK